MEKRNSLALMSSTISMAAQVIYLLVNFVLRRFFIQYFGIDASEYVICHAITTVYLSDEERKIGFLFLLEKLFVVNIYAACRIYMRYMLAIYVQHAGDIYPICL